MKYIFVLMLGIVTSCTSQKRDYPAINSSNHSENIFGHVVEDAFRNLENEKDSLVTQWHKNQSDFTVDYFKNIPEKELWMSDIEKFKKGYITKPYMIRYCDSDRFYYLMYYMDTNSTKLFYKDSQASEPVELFNTLNYNSETPYYITYIKPSFDGKKIAFSITEGGGLEALILIIQTDKKESKPKIVTNGAPDKFGGINWLPDSSGFVYTRFPVVAKEEQGYKSYSTTNKYTLDKESDTLLFSAAIVGVENSSLFSMIGIHSSSSKYAIGYLGSSDDFWDAYYIEIAQLTIGNQQWKKLFTKQDKVLYDSTYLIDETLFVRSASTNNNNLASIDLSNSSMQIKPFLKQFENEILQDFVFTSRGLFITTQKNGVQQKLYKLENNSPKEIVLPQSAGKITLISKSHTQDNLWLGTSGWTTKYLKYQYTTQGEFLADKFNADVTTNEYDDLEVIETEYISHDGVSVPISIITKKGRTYNGQYPTLIYGYGAFNEAMSPSFMPMYLHWVNKGGILVFPHIRGGSEKGVSWYEAGKKKTKINSWMDIISAVEYLIDNKYTNKEKTVLMTPSGGAVAGGMAVNTKPNLFKVFIAEVPLLNPARVDFGAFDNNYDLEFGDIKNPEEVPALLAMDPYLNITPQNYPTIFVVAAGQDDKLGLWQSSKYIARLQQISQSNNPHLFYVDKEGGHSAVTDISVYGMIFGLAQNLTFDK